MDWTAAIDKNRQALKQVLAMLVGLADLAGLELPIFPCGRRWPREARSDEGYAPSTLPRHLYRAILRLLRPAEAAARRLVIVAARGLAVTLPRQRPRKPEPRLTILRNGVGTGIVMPAAGESAPPRSFGFRLFDPPRRWPTRKPTRNGVPRISFPGLIDPFPVARRTPPTPFDAIDATRLTQRLAALARTLDDLPRQARRFALWQARLDLASRSEKQGDMPVRRGRMPRVRRIWPLRVGRPRGWRGRHEVHDILNETHGLALWAMEKAPDTS
jgi:hypothetical protein